MSVVQAKDAIGIFNISSPLFGCLRQHSGFDHRWELTLQFSYFVGNIFSKQARDPSEMYGNAFQSHSKCIPDNIQ